MKFQNENISKQKVLHAFFEDLLLTYPKLFDMLLMPFINYICKKQCVLCMLVWYQEHPECLI